MVILRRVAGRLPFLLVAVLATTLQTAEGGRVLQGHVPRAVRAELPLSDVSPQERMALAIGLPVRDQVGLDKFVKEVSDPTSPNFRQYLTPEQFAERFGPTQEEYDAVIRFAESRGLKVTNVHPNRLVVDVSGSAADVQRTFHITIRNFRHPTEGRTFFAPDSDPVLDAPVPIMQISGLSNYWVRRPRMKIKPLGAFDSNPTPKDGTGPGGAYSGNDFRAAYLPGVGLTGAGQAVGLVEFDGYIFNNIFAYEQTSNLPNVPLQNVLVDGYSGAAGTNNGEVCLDIEVAIAMAPGLSQVIVYEAPDTSPWEDILSRIANDNQAKQISCSWGGGPPSPTAEQIFQQMAAQGQTFFNASGDDGAVINNADIFPSDSPNVVQVGGTSLGTVSNGGAWSYETTWTWGQTRGGTVASGGGISTVYPIPSWQQGINMGSNQGSTTFRNFPDVALTADNIYEVSDNGRSSNVGGTSASAPLWAAFTALVNQQAANEGKPPVGFINPVVYQLGSSSGYGALFHDITTGDNVTNLSGDRFHATVGYDLCTGWGTPTPALISALINPGAPITTYSVTTTIGLPNSGTVAGAGTYPAGAPATVTAAAYPGFTFTGWTENGGVASTSASYSFTVNSNRDLVATFAANDVQYSVIVLPLPIRKAGTVFGTGIFQGGSFQMVYAFPKRGFVFLYWLEDGIPVSTDAFYGFTLDNDRVLTGVFAKGRAKGRGRHR